MCPTIYEFDGIKVKIHAQDHNPPHVHVEGKGCEARFNLKTLELLTNTGFSRSDIKRIQKEIRIRAVSLLEIWETYNA